MCSEIDLRRHIACEVCDVSVSGGYDPRFNQVRFILCHTRNVSFTLVWHLDCNLPEYGQK